MALEDEYALLDELSGLTSFLDTYLATSDAPQFTKDKIRAQMTRYSGAEPKEIALNRIRQSMYGTSR